MTELKLKRGVESILPKGQRKSLRAVSKWLDYEATHSKITPLEFLLGVMHDKKKPFEWRFMAASKAAPYMHPTMKAISASGLNTLNHEDAVKELAGEIAQEEVRLRTEQAAEDRLLAKVLDGTLVREEIDAGTQEFDGEVSDREGESDLPDEGDGGEGDEGDVRGEAERAVG